MRFMIQLWSDETRPASAALVHALARFNEQLAQAGVLLSAEGLVASSAGVRITMREGERALTSGAFRDGARPIVGFWIVRAKSKEEAVKWATLCPLAEGDRLELRQLYGLVDLTLSLSELASV